MFTNKTLFVFYDFHFPTLPTDVILFIFMFKKQKIQLCSFFNYVHFATTMTEILTYFVYKNANLKRLAIFGSIPSLIHMDRSFYVDFESLKFKSKLTTNHPIKFTVLANKHWKKKVVWFNAVNNAHGILLLSARASARAPMFFFCFQIWILQDK